MEASCVRLTFTLPPDLLVLSPDMVDEATTFYHVALATPGMRYIYEQ
jgi:hypothetical protein